MAVTTLLELATARRDAAQAEDTAAKQALLDAQSGREAATAAKELATGELAQLNADVADTREALAEVETPADGEPLLAQLAELLTVQRAKQAEIIDREAAAAGAERLLQSAQVASNSAGSRLRVAEAALDQATAESTERDGIKAAAQAAPLSDIPGQADAVLNTAPDNEDLVAAKTRIESDVPAALIGRARERREAVRTLLARDRDSAETAEALSTNAERYAFQRAVRSLRGFTGRSGQRLQHALTLLAGVANPDNSPLTSEQAAQITETDVVTDGTAAAAAEKARDDARIAVDAEQRLVDDAVVAGLASDIDSTPAPDTTNLNNAISALAAAESAYTAALQNDLNAWEVAVPAETWQLLEDFEEARAVLTELADTNPAGLVAALVTAEQALAAKLEEADKAERTERFLAGEIMARQADVEIESNFAGRRRLSALRGDA